MPLTLQSCSGSRGSLKTWDRGSFCKYVDCQAARPRPKGSGWVTLPGGKASGWRCPWPGTRSAPHKAGGGQGRLGSRVGGRSVTAWWPNKGENISSNECASVFSLAVPAVWYQQDILVPATHTLSPQHPQCTPPSLQLLAFISQPQQALDGLKQEAACALWYELLQGKGEG